MSDFSEIWRNGQLLGSLVEDVPAEVVIDSQGVGSAQLTYQCEWDKAVTLSRELSVHPTFDWLYAKRAVISREEALMARVRVEYEGVDPGSDSEVGSEDRWSYALEGSTSSEPVETHRRFNVVAGDADSPNEATGAMFSKSGDDAGKFIGFKPLLVDGQSNPKAGNRSYLECGVIYTATRTYSHKSLPSLRISMNKLGEIDNPPKSPFLPQVTTGRNWLFLTCDATQVGRGMRLTRKWRLSGRNGWDRDWYDGALSDTDDLHSS